MKSDRIRARSPVDAGLIATALLALACPAAAQPVIDSTAQGRPQTGLRQVPLVIETSDGKRHHYRVEVAATPAQQEIGMMWRRQVPAGTGMIFPMDPPRMASFWMRNTLASLDIIFISPGGRVLNVAAGTVPLSHAPLLSLGKVSAVLELAAGEAGRIGLKPGDEVQW